MHSRRTGQTVFELLIALSAIFGLVAGSYYGSQWGIPAAILGGIIGCVAGYYVGFFPLALCAFVLTQWDKWENKGD
jgi:uncharacterized membrane protein